LLVISPFGLLNVPFTYRMKNTMRETFNERLGVLHEVLSELQVTSRLGSKVNIAAGFQNLLQVTLSARKKHRGMFLIGNGASASMASHIAADLCKNAHLSTEVFTDCSLLTAVANDVGAEQLFSVPLQRRGRKNDILVAISSSGKSPNILAAVKTARKIGMRVVTFSAMKPDNPLRRSGDLNFYVKADTYGIAESAHAALLHYWVDMVSG